MGCENIKRKSQRILQMIKVCKIRCYPNKSQIDKINNVLSSCRYVSNLYIEYNIKRYETTKEFLSGYDFAKILTKLKKTTPRFYWLNFFSKTHQF